MYPPEANVELECLSRAQLEALRHVESHDVRQRPLAHDSVARSLKQSESSKSALEMVLANICNIARVMIHFHPDRLNQKNQRVAEAILQRES